MMPTALRLALVFLLVIVATPVSAEGFWLPTGDQRLRDDLRLLADEGVIRLPTSAWPIPTEDVRAALNRVRQDGLQEEALRAALLRIQARIEPRPDGDEMRIYEVSATAGNPGLLRSYETPGREDAEFHTIGGTTNERWSLTLAATAAASPADGHSLRFDDSDLSLRWGNWLFSANTLSRWWGPGLEGSLILSNNARPMAGLSIDREKSVRSSVPVLSWIGPWRFSAFISAMEGSRADVDHALFMGMRVSFQPLQILEFGLSRSAQFCGEGRPCGFSTFGRVLLGRDNAGIRVRPEDEPGNQMAGADFRLLSPIQKLPLAFYGQLIGEDGSSSGIPERYLGLFGLETWQLLDSGSALRLLAEYSSTSCKFYDSPPQPNCAYRQGIFGAGYRYYGRSIGHTTDSDSEFWMVTGHLARANGEQWSVRLRHGKLDRIGDPDIYNPLTQGASRYESGELNWRGRVLGQDVGVQLGVERQERANGERGTGSFGFLQWRRTL